MKPRHRRRLVDHLDQAFWKATAASVFAQREQASLWALACEMDDLARFFERGGVL